MTTAQASGPAVVPTSALRSVNFFNGRLLTGDDLRLEQATQAARVARAGRAIGEGVAFGLEVEETLAVSTKARPVVSVAAGLAVARSGIALELAAPVDVSLLRDDPPPGAEPGALFADCQPFAPGTYTAGAGVYVLTVAPANQGEGRAPVSGLGNVDAVCNIALSAEALRFRLIRLALPPAELADKALLRNRVAHLCFGTRALAGFVTDPFGAAADGFGLVETLRAQTMTADEVPLATIGWSVDDGIQFVDLWSVRRRIVARGAEGRWDALLADRRRAEAEAAFLQFQAQLDDLLVEPSPQTLHAAASFELLPAAGVLPLPGPAGAGFDHAQFFSGVPTSGPAVFEAAHVRELLVDSLSFPPIELARGELVWLYLVHDNLAPPDPGAAPQRYVLFANGHLRYRANAHFELSYWNFANYAELG